MAVLIGSARIDENGKIKGGKAGDQTGKEVAVETWYLDKKGWRVFRAKKKEVADKIAYDMKAACDNNLIGYDQSQNQTLWNLACSLGFDCAKVKTACETDCSQLVRVCINYAGIPIGMFSTADEPQYILGTGDFYELTEARYTKESSYLRKGDILCTPRKGHTVVVLTDGANAYNKITVDGYWGKDTTTATEEYFNLTTDGKIVKQYHGNKKLCPNCTGGWEWKLIGYKGSPVIKAIQKMLNKEGYNVGSEDGLVGQKFITGLAKFLKAKGYISSYPTKLDATLVKGWQRFINEHSK